MKLKYLFKTIILFLSIVYRDWYGCKIKPKTAWEVSKDIWLN